MKNTLALLIALQSFWACYSQQQTHDYIALTAPDRDTVGTIFGHIFWNVAPKILFQLPPEDSLDAAAYSGIQLEIENFYYDTSNVMLRFPGKSWINSRKRSYISYDIYEDSPYRPKVRLLPDIYSIQPFSVRLNLFEFFELYPGFLEEYRTGTLLEIQLNMRIQADSLPFEKIYSNIDTIYLPPATPDDIAGFNYLRSNSIGMFDFFTFSADDKLSASQWEYVRDNFKNSIISEYAEYYVFMQMISQRRIQGNAHTNEEIKQLEIVLFKNLRNSKSDLIADWAKKRLQNSGITD